MKTLLWILLSANSAFATSVDRVPADWSVVPGSKVSIKIKYTFGTHELKSNAIEGVLSQNHAFEDVSGELTVPIDSIKEGSAKLECHLRESLGLDYEKSGFPESHVCDDKNQLPASGPDSVVYPSVKLSIKRLIAAEKTKTERYRVEGAWTIHGVTKPADFEVKVTEGPDSVSVRGDSEFALKDFGITVKKAFVISAADKARVEFDLKFTRP